MRKRPIHRAISEVLKSAGKPMTPMEIHAAIVDRALYPFMAQDPLEVVKGQLRRHCQELNFRSARAVKYFTMTEDGRFALLSRPFRTQPSLFKIASTASGQEPSLVSVPVDHEDEEEGKPRPNAPTHSEIQWRLLELGGNMGLSVWAPKADRHKTWNGHALKEAPRLLSKLPVHFDEASNKTIENIDVLWIQDNAIVTAFEVEHTTQIYSGLLRMSDLITRQPTTNFSLYLVAPDNKLAKFGREVTRSTFSSGKRPLYSVCRFLPYTSLLERLAAVQNVVRHLKPEFLDDIAVVIDPHAQPSK